MPEQHYPLPLPQNLCQPYTLEPLPSQRPCWSQRVDSLASTAGITSRLQLGKAEVVRRLRNFQNMDRPEHQSFGHLKEKGVGRGGWKWFLFHQTNICTIPKATLGKQRWPEVKHVWAFLRTMVPSQGSHLCEKTAFSMQKKKSRLRKSENAVRLLHTKNSDLKHQNVFSLFVFCTQRNRDRDKF